MNQTKVRRGKLHFYDLYGCLRRDTEHQYPLARRIKIHARVLSPALVILALFVQVILYLSLKAMVDHGQ